MRDRAVCVLYELELNLRDVDEESRFGHCVERCRALTHGSRDQRAVGELDREPLARRKLVASDIVVEELRVDVDRRSQGRRELALIVAALAALESVGVEGREAGSP